MCGNKANWTAESHLIIYVWKFALYKYQILLSLSSIFFVLQGYRHGTARCGITVREIRVRPMKMLDITSPTGQSTVRPYSMLDWQASRSHTYYCSNAPAIFTLQIWACAIRSVIEEKKVNPPKSTKIKTSNNYGLDFNISLQHFVGTNVQIPVHRSTDGQTDRQLKATSGYFLFYMKISYIVTLHLCTTID